MGDFQGHPFRGNQWSEGGGAHVGGGSREATQVVGAGAQGRVEKYPPVPPITWRDGEPVRVVAGLVVRDGPVPNTSSISSSLDSSETLPGIRVVKMDDVRPEGGWGGYKGYGYASASDNDHVERLRDAIKESGEITPLIVVVNKDGPYVLEGGHRVAALSALGVPEFPALVVLDTSEETGIHPSDVLTSDVERATGWSPARRV